MKVQFLGHLIETDYIYEITKITKDIKTYRNEDGIFVATSSLVMFTINFLNEKSLPVIKYLPPMREAKWKKVLDVTRSYWIASESELEESIQKAIESLEKVKKELISYTGQSTIPKIEW